MSKIAPVALPPVAFTAVQSAAKLAAAPVIVMTPPAAQTRPSASPVASVATLAPTTLASLVLAQVGHGEAADGESHSENGQGRRHVTPPPAPEPTPRAAPVETSYDAAAPQRAAALASQILQAGEAAAASRATAQAWTTEQWSQSVQMQGQAALAVFAAMEAQMGVRQPTEPKPLTETRPATSVRA